MLSINLTMTLVVVLVTPLSILQPAPSPSFPTRALRHSSASKASLAVILREYVGEQKLVDAFAYGPHAQQRFDALNAEPYTAGERAQFMGSPPTPVRVLSIISSMPWSL